MRVRAAASGRVEPWRPGWSTLTVMGTGAVRRPRGRAHARVVGRAFTGILVLGTLTSCADERADPPPAGTSAARAPAEHGADELEESARAIVSFLRGDTPFADIRLADTVVLRLAPQGGGERRAVPREQLRDRSSWAVHSESMGSTYRFAAPAGLTELTTAPGRHMRCFDQPLASVAGEMAGLPHVGARLAPPDLESCLQTWNLTLVFDPIERPPTLTGAVYDQWEW